MAAMWGCAACGAYEVYTNNSHRFFSQPADDLHTGAARGLVRGAMFPICAIIALPTVVPGEIANPPFRK